MLFNETDAYSKGKKKQSEDSKRSVFSFNHLSLHTVFSTFSLFPPVKKKTIFFLNSDSVDRTSKAGCDASGFHITDAEIAQSQKKKSRVCKVFNS